MKIESQEGSTKSFKTARNRPVCLKTLMKSRKTLHSIVLAQREMARAGGPLQLSASERQAQAPMVVAVIISIRPLIATGIVCL
jgi:hypothetical protein